ncbi:FAD-binding oxidoreductase [Microbacterium sp. 18062]|uniref:FAD-binding oxidoreductase n=1 Tax=Microbacterium sp. 18062 TaxID=2681410 RepID=UPI00135CC8FC|nr:FAD-binding oxidoreductase [Microbacterium sp. 18062]
MPHASTPASPALTAQIVQRLREIVGDDAVTDHAALNADKDWPLRDPYWVPGDDTYAPSVAVHPADTAQIQAILKLAGETGIPVWTHSQGRNNGYGGPSPRVGGSISISLRRMNRILEIDEDLAYAVVEPGVRWFDLYDELRARGSRLMLSIPDLGWGSVIGNSLDNGVTYLPYGADFMAPTGMEVVLADGTLLRTGMGAMPDNPTWHLYKRGVGPALDPLFTQSNLGIVVKMGVWLAPRPETYAPLKMTLARDEDLAQAVDVLRELRLRNQLRGVPCLYSTLMAATMTGVPEVIRRSEEGMVPEEEIDEIAVRTGLGRWYLRAAVWGTSAEVDVQLAQIRAAWASIPGSTLTVEGRYTPEEYEGIESISNRITVGVPNLDAIRYKGEGFGHIGIAPLVPLEGSRVMRVVETVRATTEERTGLNYKAGVMLLNERTCAVVSAINFDPRQADETRAAYETARALVHELAALGYSEYRSHLDFMQEVADFMSWNDHAYRRFVERIKDAVDPAGILSPGRYGIWPARDR